MAAGAGPAGSGPCGVPAGRQAVPVQRVQQREVVSGQPQRPAAMFAASASGRPCPGWPGRTGPGAWRTSRRIAEALAAPRGNAEVDLESDRVNRLPGPSAGRCTRSMTHRRWAVCGHRLWFANSDSACGSRPGCLVDALLAP
ncbi:hypothetical protein GCM10010343_09140 [Streptomyces avidinii]|nr:hypothetical protein GCM10010343_09140 [Streptomyces avidinii]